MNAKDTLNKIRELIDSYEFPEMPPTEDTYSWAFLLRLRDFIKDYEYPEGEGHTDTVCFNDVKDMISTILTEWYPNRMDVVENSVYYHLHDARRNWIFGENPLEPIEDTLKKLQEAEATETIRSYRYNNSKKC